MTNKFFKLDIKPKQPDEIPDNKKPITERFRKKILMYVKAFAWKNVGLKLSHWLRVTYNGLLGQAQRLLHGESLGFDIKQNSIVYIIIVLGLLVLLKLLKII